MKKTNDGGPAFPADAHAVAGMTLRDYFAAKAMSIVDKMYMQSFRDGNDFTSEYLPFECFKQVAKDAYKLADAMLAAREQEEGEA